jgi:hypothetical protein
MNTVNTATGYERVARGSIPGMGHCLFSLFCSVQTCAGALPISYPMGKSVSFPKVERGRSVKVTTYVHLLTRSGREELYLHSPMRLRGAELN